MTDNSSIDLSLTNLWRSWRAFRRGKKPSRAIIMFESDLESNLLHLCLELNNGMYRHGTYDHKIVNEKKRRDIAVATVRDRVVHRLIYDYLVPRVDKRLDYDVWSCRPGKGLHAGLQRTQQLADKYSDGWFWRADITKFFDHIDHFRLKNCLGRHVSDGRAINLLDKIIDSYETSQSVSQSVSQSGVPIGNLTSQIFANIYLNEFDRFVRCELKPFGYVRYGDDFVLFLSDRAGAVEVQNLATNWLLDELHLPVHASNNVVMKVHRGLYSLGHRVYPGQVPVIDKAMSVKIIQQINHRNAASYRAMKLSAKQVDQLPWALL